MISNSERKSTKIAIPRKIILWDWKKNEVPPRHAKMQGFMTPTPAVQKKLKGFLFQGEKER